jgi:tyrosine-protein kinase Etk/Wzc
MAEKENQEVQKSDIQLRNYDGIYMSALLFKYRWFIIVFVFLATGASVLISLKLPNWYASTANVVPPQSSDTGFESALGGISSALREFGVSSLGKKTDGYDFIVILHSRTVKDSIITKYNLAESYELCDTCWYKLRKKFDENLSIVYEKEGNYTITIMDKDPHKAADMANDYVNISNQIAMDVYRRETTHNREFMEQRIVAIDSAITQVTDSMSRISRVYGILHPLEQARAVSSALAELKAEEVKYSILYDLNVANYGVGDPLTMQLKQMRDQTQAELTKAYKQAGFAGNFALEDAGEIGLLYARYYAEFEAFTKIKAMLAPMLEKTKLDEQKMLQTLIFLDKAIPADRKAKPKRSLIVMGTAIGSFVIVVMFILIVSSYNNFKKNYKELLANKNA